MKIKMGNLIKKCFKITQVAFYIFLLLAGQVAYAAVLPSNKVGLDMTGFTIGNSAYSEPGGQPTASGQFKNGNIGSYPEGSCVPISIYATNKDNVAGEIELFPSYDYYNSGIIGIENLEYISTALLDPEDTVDNLNDFTFHQSSISSAGGFNDLAGNFVAATVSGPYSGDDTSTNAINATDAQRHYNMVLQNVPVDATVAVLFCARLGIDSSQYNGASMSVKLADYGAQNVPIQVNQLLELPSLTISKTVVGGTNTPDEWSFTVSPAINGISVYNIPSGQNSVTIDNINTDGDYTITESGPAGYNFTNGSGTNCVFDTNGNATASVAAGNPADNATCDFTNTENTQSTITVIKQVVNDNGGTAIVDDFNLYIDADSVTSGTANPVDPGTYTVSEDNLDGYAATFSGDCDSNGQIVIGDSENLTCTITNDDEAAEITVIKNVINDDNGTMVASDFTMTVTATNPSLSSFPGSATGTVITVDAGAYSIDEQFASEYTKVLGADCSGTINIGQSVSCTITNDDITPPPPDPGTLTVVVNVANDDQGILTPDNFTINVTGNTPSPASFNGSSNGTDVLLGAGDYNAVIADLQDYSVTYSADCDSSIAAAETKTCTIDLDDNPASPITGALNVITEVINTHGRSMIPSDVSILIDTDSTDQQILGSALGVLVTLNLGHFEVLAPDFAHYIKRLTGDCDGTIAGGENLTCNIEYRDRSSGGGGGGGGYIDPNDNGDDPGDEDPQDEPEEDVDPAVDDQQNPEPPKDVLGEKITDDESTDDPAQDSEQSSDYVILPVTSGINLFPYLLSLAIGLFFIGRALTMLRKKVKSNL